MDAGHPISLVVGIVIGALVTWRWRRRPLQLDVNVRHDTEESDNG